MLPIRLYQVLKGSVYEISQRLARIMGFVAIIPLIMGSIIMDVPIYQYHFSDPSIRDEISSTIQSVEDCLNLEERFRTDTYQLALLIIVSFYVLNEIIYSIVILRLFISRVLIIARASGTDYNDITVGNGYGPKNIKKNLFLFSIIKLTNLTILAIISNYIALINYGLQWPLYTLNIDTICNCLSVFLSLESSQAIYDKIFYFCHLLCFRCCVRVCFCCCLPLDKKKQHNKSEKKEIQLTTKVDTNVTPHNATSKDIGNKNKSCSVASDYGETQENTNRTQMGTISIDAKWEIGSNTDDLEDRIGSLGSLGSAKVGPGTLQSAVDVEVNHLV